MGNMNVGTKILTASLLCFCGGNVLAQGSRYTDRCTVNFVNVTGIKTSDFENDTAPNLKERKLGTFDPVVNEEELTTRSFRLPNTKLYVIASVWYTDESMGGEDSQDSIMLQLTISPKPKRDIFAGLQFAEAEVLSRNFEVARATTIYKSRGRSFLITMECRRHRLP